MEKEDRRERIIDRTRQPGVIWGTPGLMSESRGEAPVVSASVSRVGRWSVKTSVLSVSGVSSFSLYAFLSDLFILARPTKYVRPVIGSTFFSLSCRAVSAYGCREFSLSGGRPVQFTYQPSQRNVHL